MNKPLNKVVANQKKKIVPYDYFEINFISCIDQITTKKTLLKSIVFHANFNMVYFYISSETFLKDDPDDKSTEGMDPHSFYLRQLRLQHANEKNIWLQNKELNEIAFKRIDDSVTDSMRFVQRHDIEKDRYKHNQYGHISQLMNFVQFTETEEFLKSLEEKRFGEG